MTAVSAALPTSSRRRVLTALGTAAAFLLCAAIVVVGARVITLASPGAASPYYECVEPLANPVVPDASDPPVSYAPAIWSSGMPCGPFSG